MSMTVSQAMKRLLQAAVVTAIIVFLVRSVAVNWDKVREFDWSFDPGFLTLSVALFILSYAMLPWIWARVLKATGYPIRYGLAWNIYFYSNLAKYIPGKIWTILGVSYVAGKYGIPARASAASAVFAQLYSLLSSIVFFSIFLILKEFRTGIAGIAWLVPVVLALLTVSVFPEPLERAANVVLRRLGRQELDIAFSTRDAVQFIFLYLLWWCFTGIAFGVFVASVAGWGQVNLLFAAGMFALAYAAGFLAIFAPGGIGVREGVLAVLLGSYLPVSVAIIIAALARLLMTGIEVLCALPPVLKGKQYGKSPAKEKIS